MTQNEKTLAIIKKVADKHDVNVRDIFSRNQSRNFAAARQEAYYEVKEHRVLNVALLAKVFDRDETTVRHGIREHIQRLEKQARRAWAGATEGIVA